MRCERNHGLPISAVAMNHFSRSVANCWVTFIRFLHGPAPSCCQVGNRGKFCFAPCSWWRATWSIQQRPPEQPHGLLTPKDMLSGRQQEIHAERDRKLKEGRKQ